MDKQYRYVHLNFQQVIGLSDSLDELSNKNKNRLDILNILSSII